MSAGEARLKELLSLVTGVEVLRWTNPRRDVMRTLVRDEADDTPAFTFPRLRSLAFRQSSKHGESEDPAIDSAALCVLLKAAPRLEMINADCTVDAEPYGDDFDINFLPIKHAIINIRGLNIAVFDVTSLILRALDSATTNYLRIGNVPFGRYFFELLEDLENLQHLELTWEYEDALAACLPHVKPILGNLPSLRILKIAVQLPDDGLDDTDEISHDILAAVPVQVKIAVLSLRVDNIEQGPLAEFARARRDTALNTLVVVTPLARILFEKKRVGSGWVWQEMDRRMHSE